VGEVEKVYRIPIVYVFDMYNALVAAPQTSRITVAEGFGGARRLRRAV
jgi:hypothetical protein